MTGIDLLETHVLITVDNWKDPVVHVFEEKATGQQSEWAEAKKAGRNTRMFEGKPMYRIVEYHASE